MEEYKPLTPQQVELTGGLCALALSHQPTLNALGILLLTNIRQGEPAQVGQPPNPAVAMEAMRAVKDPNSPLCDLIKQVCSLVLSPVAIEYTERHQHCTEDEDDGSLPADFNLEDLLPK